MTTIQLGDITAEVVLKDIKNIHLSVYPPDGRVRISAPLRMDLDTLRIYAISRLGWIRQQQRKLHEQERETVREYLERESHYVWGKRYLLKVVEVEESPAIELNHSQMILRVRAGSDTAKRHTIVEEWYRQQIRLEAPALIAKWEERLGVSVARFFVQRMKTRWGSCNTQTGSIRLNTELAKKNKECLEYIIVHEMVHLLEPTHNQRFVRLMNEFMPQWKERREELNRAPLGHVEWGY